MKDLTLYINEKLVINKDSSNEATIPNTAEGVLSFFDEYFDEWFKQSDWHKEVKTSILNKEILSNHVRNNIEKDFNPEKPLDLLPPDFVKYMKANYKLNETN